MAVRQVALLVDGMTYPMSVKSKEFSSGSTGFYAWGKAPISEEERYQVSCTMVLIGSKPKPEAEPTG